MPDSEPHRSNQRASRTRPRSRTPRTPRRPRAERARRPAPSPTRPRSHQTPRLTQNPAPAARTQRTTPQARRRTNRPTLMARIAAKQPHPPLPPTSVDTASPCLPSHRVLSLMLSRRPQTEREGRQGSDPTSRATAATPETEEQHGLTQRVTMPRSGATYTANSATRPDQTPGSQKSHKSREEPRRLQRHDYR